MDFRILHFSASFYIELLIFVVNLYETAILGQCWLVRCDGSSVSQHAIHLVTLIVDARSLSQIHHTKFNLKGEPGILNTLHKGYPQNRRENGCLETDIKAGTNILRGPATSSQLETLFYLLRSKTETGWGDRRNKKDSLWICFLCMFIVYSGMITGQIGEGRETCQLTVTPSRMLRNETNYEHRTFLAGNSFWAA